MKVENWLSKSSGLLKNAGISTARLDCLVLLEDATNKDRSWLIAHNDFVIPEAAQRQLDKQIVRRLRHEPLSYIRGISEFYGRTFMVNPHTLEPRPESETMIDLLKKAAGDAISIVDIGTGSGCLAITAKLEVPGAQVFATDINEKCVQTARQNAKKLKTDVTFYQGNLLEPLPSIFSQQKSGLSQVSTEPVLFSRNGKSRTNSTTSEYRGEKTGSEPQGMDRVRSSAQEQDNAGAKVLLANLPYVPDSHTINAAAMFEPRHAIFGGMDGLDVYRQLFDQIKKLPKKPKFVLTESLPFQHAELAGIAKSAGYKLEKTDDFIQLYKVAGDRF